MPLRCPGRPCTCEKKSISGWSSPRSAVVERMSSQPRLHPLARHNIVLVRPQLDPRALRLSAHDDDVDVFRVRIRGREAAVDDQRLDDPAVARLGRALGPDSSAYSSELREALVDVLPSQVGIHEIAEPERCTLIVGRTAERSYEARTLLVLGQELDVGTGEKVRLPACVQFFAKFSLRGVVADRQRAREIAQQARLEPICKCEAVRRRHAAPRRCCRRLRAETTSYPEKRRARGK